LPEASHPSDRGRDSFARVNRNRQIRRSLRGLIRIRFKYKEDRRHQDWCQKGESEADDQHGDPRSKGSASGCKRLRPDSGVGVKGTAARSGAQEDGKERAEETAATVTGTSSNYATARKICGQEPTSKGSGRFESPD